MKYTTFSPKQLKVLNWWLDPKTKDKDAIVAYGSVRSGKTVSMTLSFIFWAMINFKNESFAICGKTITSTHRNIISHLTEWLPSDFDVEIRRGNSFVKITVDGIINTFYIFGGKDESSQDLIQGMTLAGILLDEVALMPRSFVDQAMARCSVEGSKFWFNCNPGSPEHWFNKHWILKEKNQLILHFTMDDNFGLSPDIKRRLETSFDGVFFDRYIKGLWVLAEGLVYPAFKKEIHLKKSPPNLKNFYVAMDYGIQNPTAFLLIGSNNNHHYVVKEYYHSGRETNRQKTDEEYLHDLLDFVGDYPVKGLIIDPSAASFIVSARIHLPFKTIKARNTVIEGIQRTSEMLSNERLFIDPSCERLIGEFGMYVWNNKVADTVVKEHDHALDALRYYVMTTRAYEEKEEYIPLFQRGGIWP